MSVEPDSLVTDEVPGPPRRPSVTPCECCGGTEDCCADEHCDALSFAATNTQVSGFGFGPYAFTSPFFVNMFAPTGTYYRDSVVEVESGVWLRMELRASILCTDDIVSANVFIFVYMIRDLGGGDVRYYGNTQTLITFGPIDCEDLGDIAAAGFWGPATFSVSGTSSASGQYTLGSGSVDPPGGGCCAAECEGGYYCCNEGADWFGATDVPPKDVTGTCISGPLTGMTIDCTGTVAKASIQGNCVLYFGPTSNSDFRAEIYILCDGDVYGSVQVGPTSTLPFAEYITEWQIVGSVTTVNSTSPLDFEVTFTAGYLSGNVFQFVE